MQTIPFKAICGSHADKFTALINAGWQFEMCVNRRLRYKRYNAYRNGQLMLGRFSCIADLILTAYQIHKS